MEINKIYTKIEQLISSITPDEGKEAIFSARIYENITEYEFSWLLENDEEDYYKMGDDSADEVFYKLIELLKTLQKDMVSKNEPWTHCKITLSDKGEFNIEFADIPHEDSWPGLFLKRVSELNQQEAYDEYGVPKREWKKRKILYGKES